MSGPRFEFHPSARIDLLEAFEWYAERSLPTATEFVHEAEATVARIQEAPRRWRRDEHGTRRHGVRAIPYSIVYMVTDDEITIVAVAHESRRPEYWRSRLQT